MAYVGFRKVKPSDVQKGRLVEDVQFVTDTVTNILHCLNRPIKGWFLLKHRQLQEGKPFVHEGVSFDPSRLALHSEGDFTADIWVW